ncbi:MAG: aminotransferase class V-fold PLP-dependent enzyme [Gemmatimonadota bacterium]
MTDTNAAPRYDLAAWRGRIPLLETTIPLANCSQAPQTDVTRAAAEAFLDSWNRTGMDWDAWMAEVDAAKAAFASLIGADEDEVALSTSVSAATASLASALDLSERDTILVAGAEFPTVAHVWQAQLARGARIAWAPVTDGVVPLDAYADAIHDRTRVVSACHAYYQNGFKQDVGTIAELAHEHGALIYVDAYQTLGTEPIDVKELDIDVLASGNLQFLMGVAGVAFLYVRRELISRLRPTVTGWFGREDPFAFRADRLDWAATARRLETGTPPVPSVYIARAGMEMLASIGLDAIGEWNRTLSARLAEGGLARGLEIHGPADPDLRAPTTAFLVPGDSHDVEAAMRRRGVLPSARGPVVRLAPHFFNTLEDVDTALDTLVEVLAGADAQARGAG